MSVLEEPYFDIPVDRYIWSILHTLIVIGNAILKHLINIIQSKIQTLSVREIRLRREVRELTAEIRYLMDKKGH